MLLSRFRSPAIVRACGAIAVATAVFLASCKGDDGPPGKDGEPAPPPPPTRSDALPGFNLLIQDVAGGTGPNGNLQVGDRPRITFTAQEGEQGATAEGDPIPPESWAFQELLFAGPTTNYQLILSFGDIAGNSTQNADGSWTFTFPDPIPATVPEQINQEDTIPYESGTIAGQPLPDGTYTIGMSMRQDIEIEGTVFRDATSTQIDVLLGAATTLEHPELVTDANCNNCHTVLRAHGENRYGVRNCVLCHTNGSEDLNDPSAVAGETPGLTIAFHDMIHKIHTGRHLPSVNGKSVGFDGNPVYGAGKSYVIVRSRGEFDFSHVGFPQWPHLSQGMPRDLGYGALSDDEKAVENAILGGPTNCSACHGDPDGDGPGEAPADADSIYSDAKITTRACIACHDDWDPERQYRANGLVMVSRLPDDTCGSCHGDNATVPNVPPSVRHAHVHPLLDAGDPPVWGAGPVGLEFNVTAIADIGDGDGVVEVGEKIEVTLDVVDRDGNAVAGTDVQRMEVVVTGPMENPNLLYVTQFTSTGKLPSTVLGAGPTHTFVLPERVEYEIAAMNTAVEFATARTPHYPTEFGMADATAVYTVATGGMPTTTLAEPVAAYQNYADVADGSAFAAGNVIVIDEGSASAEYLTVAGVEDDRLWFDAPLDVAGIRPELAHDAGAEVVIVTPVPVAAMDYTLDPMAGTVTFAMAPSDRVLVSYTTDFVVPPMYRGTINNSPSLDPDAVVLDERIGEWTGFDLVAGTYSLGVYGETGFDVTVTNGTSQVTTYTEGSEGDTVVRFRLGSDGALDEYERIAGAATCYACHRDLQFHGAHRRGYDNCLLCHAPAGAEDWPQYNTAMLDSPETPGVSIEFREMIHKIHHGRLLAAGEDYVVAGFRGTPHSYEEVGFPSFLGETANCAACHGADNEAWYQPTDRRHPDQSPLAPQLVWKFVCGSCHDDAGAQAHIATNTAEDLESCSVCHGPGKDQSVQVVHENSAR